MDRIARNGSLEADLMFTRFLNDNKRPGTRSSTCIYFAAEEPPISDPILILNGENKGVINNASIQWALVSGTRAADVVVEAMSRRS